ncbi:hypothetical protein [Chengkuizengella sediminis]|uniref:hypothetical protein n=1 Tax=Chengkuizengella sediminis TaxID=1885917 RepID=UPI0013899CB2|nr:hypothetical protein [Chengkuizengella sediminis]NDI33615.1 hypothetical protein [Chengkuizengella sediminis]
MGIKDEPFVVAQSVSVEGDPYNTDTEGVILLPDDSIPKVVLSVDVCIKQPERTQVCIDTMAQIAVVGITFLSNPIDMTYEIHRNGNRIAIINDQMEFASNAPGARHTNFPNFPILDNNPYAGINTYDLVCTAVTGFNNFVASRSLKVTVFTV